MASAEPRRLRVRRDLLLFDYALLALGFASLLLWALAFNPGLLPGERDIVRVVDYAALGLLGVLLVGKLVRSESPLRFAKESWYALPGLLPLSDPLFIPERFWGPFQVVIVVSRLVIALDQAFGERILHGIFRRYRAMIVEELTDPILDSILAILQQSLVRGRYLESLGRSLDERRPLVRESVRKALEASPKLTSLSKFGPVKRYIDGAVEEAVDAAVVALTSEEMNRLVAESVDRAFTDFRKTVKDRSWRREGYGVSEVAVGLFRPEKPPPPGAGDRDAAGAPGARDGDEPRPGAGPGGGGGAGA